MRAERSLIKVTSTGTFEPRHNSQPLDCLRGFKVGKRLFYEQATLSMKEAYAMAVEVMACNMMADDTTAGIDAFINKRPMPEWRGK